MGQISRLWVFNGLRPVHRKHADALIERYKELKVSDVVLGLSHDDGAFRLLSPAKEFIEVGKRFVQEGFAVHMMPWLHPDEQWMRTAAAICIPIVLQSGATSLMMDMEGTWIRRSDASNKKKRPATFQRFNELYLNKRQGDFLVGITTHPGAINSGALSPLLALADYIIPQAYSRRVKTQRDRSVGDITPGVIQGTAYQKLKRGELLNKRIIMGLASWQQDVPDFGGVYGAMSAALNATLGFDIHEVAYWSYPSIRGDVFKFIKELVDGTIPNVNPLLSRRSRAMSGTSRLDAQFGFETAAQRQGAIAAAQGFGLKTEDFKYAKEVFQQSSLLYDFATGKWNDEA